ncbi:uncharacterized protein LOC124279467 [Haliotis rubra]|uniref:uncharacterized protein LOC124279467 n=1 Tax=Haliotis rubra TaxID=36100 RepID=UPI001EE63669|nr:uncharacterized protein LOC124279467 [Haliotis rubra]
MNGAVIILLLALVASPVINATTLFPQLLHPRLRFPGVYPRAYPGVVQPGLRQVFPTGIYREDLYDYPYGQRSVLGGHYRPSVLPQYQPIYADPRDSYIYDVFDTQASRRAGVGPASAATAAAAPVNAPAGVALPVRV